MLNESVGAVVTTYDKNISPLSGRRARYFRAVHYGRGLVGPVVSEFSDAVALYRARHGAAPGHVVCATSICASTWWDSDGLPEILVRRNGRSAGEVWSVPMPSSENMTTILN